MRWRRGSLTWLGVPFLTYKLPYRGDTIDFSQKIKLTTRCHFGRRCRKTWLKVFEAQGTVYRSISLDFRAHFHFVFQESPTSTLFSYLQKRPSHNVAISCIFIQNLVDIYSVVRHILLVVRIMVFKLSCKTMKKVCASPRTLTNSLSSSPGC